MIRQEIEILEKSNQDQCRLLNSLIRSDHSHIMSQMNHLENLYKDSVKKLESISTQNVNVNFDPHRTDCDSIFSPCYRDKSKVYQIYTNIVHLFDELRKKSKEERNRIVKSIGSSHAFDNTPMVKLLCDLFQIIEKMIKNNYQKITQLLSISSDFNLISKRYGKIVTDANQLHTGIVNMHLSFLQTIVLPSPHVNGKDSNDCSAQNDSNDGLEIAVRTMLQNLNVNPSLNSPNEDRSPSSDWSVIPSFE